MIKLNGSLFNHGNAIENCEEGITGNSALKTKLQHSKYALIPFENLYLIAANNGSLCDIQALSSEVSTEQPIVGSLLRVELNKLYTQYFVPEGKPARKIYDAILISAKEQCPFCGGIGTPHNLDHFLPKAHFPQFSILPANLVPSCLDCNLAEKGHMYATRAEDQIIQPYWDRFHIFSEQWVFAKFNAGTNGEPGEFEFFVNPPAHWPDVDKRRVRKHFEEFNIAGRYSKQAACQIKTVLSQIEKLQLKGISSADIIDVLLKPGIDEAPFINHWRGVMNRSLAEHFTFDRITEADNDTVLSSIFTCPLCNGHRSICRCICKICGGMGSVTKEIASNFDLSQYEIFSCPDCGGSGCDTCNGEGKISREKALELSLLF